MHIDHIVKIGKTDDDKYIVSLVVERKKKDKNGKDTMMPSINGEEADEKTFVCDTEKDVGDALKKVLPKMKKGRMAQDDYAAAFEEIGGEE